jgi:hypothetical protein
MKTLLEAIQARLIEQLTVLGGDKAVHFLPDQYAFPETTPFPCVGLKDGPVRQHYYLGMARQKADLEVDIICCVQIHQYGMAIVGKGLSVGILELVDSVRTALEWWAPTGYKWVQANGDVDETASQLVNVTNEAGETQKLVQMKKFSMSWMKG